MSTVTMPTSSGLSRTRGSGESRGRSSRKGRSRAVHENPTAVHPGKSVSTPLATPRRALGVIDQNSRVPSATQSQKGQGLAVQTLGKKSEKKRAPTSAIKQSAPRPIRGSTTCASAVKDREREEAEEFPDIETMSRRGESDDWDSGMGFEPPAYFDSLAAALKAPLAPPPFRTSTTLTSSALSHLKLEPDTSLRPSTTVGTASPILRDEPYYIKDLDLPLDLPSIDIW